MSMSSGGVSVTLQMFLTQYRNAIADARAEWKKLKGDIEGNPINLGGSGGGNRITGGNSGGAVTDAPGPNFTGTGNGQYAMKNPFGGGATGGTNPSVPQAMTQAGGIQAAQQQAATYAAVGGAAFTMPGVGQPTQPNNPGGGGGGGPHSQRPWYLARIAARGLVVLQVANAIGEALNNQETYRQAMRLAGMDSGDQSTAELNYQRGSSIYKLPFIGGAAWNIGNGTNGILGRPTEQSLSADAIFTQRQLAFQDAAGNLGIGTAAIRNSTASARYGPYSYSRQVVESQGRLAQSLYDLTSTGLDLNTKFSALNAPQRPTRFADFTDEERWKYTSGRSLAEAADLVYQDRLGAYKQQQLLQVSNPLSSREKALTAQANEEQRQAGLDAKDQILSTLTQAQLMHSQNSYQPRVGAAGATLATARNRFSRFQTLDPKASGYNLAVGQYEADRQVSIEELRGQQKDLSDYYYHGNTVNFNPGQSLEAFRDTRVEQPSAVMKAINYALTELFGSLAVKTKPNGQ